MKTKSRNTPRKRTKEPERHRWLDPWLTVKPGTPLHRLTSEAASLIDEEEGRRGMRKRQRKEIDDRHHRERVETVVANLAYAVLMPPLTGRLALQLGNRAQGMTRYDNPALGTKPMRTLVRLMEEVNLLSLRWSTTRGEVSSIAPAYPLEDEVRGFGISLADFGRHRDEELIILTRASRGSRADDAEPNARQRVDYGETAETRAMRNEMRRLNAFLAKQHISFEDDGSGPVDAFDRTMKRHFTIRPEQPERFDQNGRLFGGFWQTLKSERRNSIRINGELVAILDYGSMFTRLAYAHLRFTAPAGDLYEIEGAEGYRSGIKLAMNTLLFDDTSRRANWPSAIGVGVGNDNDARNSASRAAEFDARLPEGWTVGKTKAAILRRHPKLDAAWGKGLGLSLMFMESRILIAVLNELMRRDIPALGLHDGLMVQRSRMQVAKAVMNEVTERLSGAPIPVAEKS